jgi:ubiquinone/menaquinone biosynthesis C-methylase UbiE
LPDRLAAPKETSVPISADQLPLPDDNLHDVGPDTDSLGRAKRQRELLEHWGLNPDTDLVEIGCGVGRLAYELATYFDKGSYTGFDIGKTPIKWLKKNYESVLPNYRFDHINVSNARYNPRGAASAENIQFPYEESSFDLACSFAVFMHMRLPEIANYFGETRRVLRPGGRAVLTMTAITENDLAKPELPILGNQRFRPIGDGVYAKRPDRPTFGLGFDRKLLATRIEMAGLEILDFTEGTWRSPEILDAPPLVVGGDVFVVTKPTR